jgi:hypothetical protein
MRFAEFEEITGTGYWRARAANDIYTLQPGKDSGADVQHPRRVPCPGHGMYGFAVKSIIQLFINS